MSYRAGDVIGEKYRLIELIGGGAMGEVFKAEHILMQKIVAIKFLHAKANNSPENIERFKREAQSAAAIEHSNICAVTDFALTDEGTFYLVMEFLEGDTLQKRLEKCGRIPPEETVFIMKQLLSVLQCAHDHGIVHRDVKPENVTLINRNDNPDFVKLLDFGIAHQDNCLTAATQNDGEEVFKTQAGFIYGTPSYIAPEQANGENIDHRVDLYACGIIMYEMLTGELPFKSKSVIVTLQKQIYEQPPHLPTGAVEHSSEFDAIIQKLLSKNREDRYNSANEVIDALDKIYADNAKPIIITQTAASDAEPAYHINGNVKLRMAETVIGQKLPDAVKNIPVKYIKYTAFASIAVLLLIIILIIANAGSDKKSSSDIEAQNSESNAAEIQQQHDVQPFIYEPQFAISSDETLHHDAKLVTAADSFNIKKDYQDCYDNIIAVDEKYHNHPNYLRFRIQAAHKLSQQRKIDNELFTSLVHDIADSFVKLTELVPDAARNKAVCEAVQALFVDYKDRYDASSTIYFLKKHQHPKLASALGYAILYSPYDINEQRKFNMIKAFDEIKKDNVEEWQKIAVNAWRVKREKCNDRAELIKTAFKTNASRETLYYGLLVPLYNSIKYDDKKAHEVCTKKPLSRTHCNFCMKWIEPAYKNWTTHLNNDTIEKSSLSFLE